MRIEEILVHILLLHYIKCKQFRSGYSKAPEIEQVSGRERIWEMAYSQCHSGKHLTIDSPGGKPRLITFSNVRGVNIPTVAEFKLST